MRSDAAAIFAGLGDVVGRDRDHPAIAHLHLAMELQQAFGLATILGTKSAAAEHEHHWIARLQFGELPVLAGVVAEFVIREGYSRHHVRSHCALPLLQINHDVVSGA
ncbi:hypothetical protein ACVWXL_002439 [Bradyrhizobium sp. GM22.5]